MVSLEETLRMGSREGTLRMGSREETLRMGSREETLRIRLREDIGRSVWDELECRRLSAFDLFIMTLMGNPRRLGSSCFRRESDHQL